jgi:predicted transcriptional regulator
MAALTQSQKLQQLIKKKHKELKHRLQDSNINQSDIAELTGLTQQAISYQLRTGRITYEVLIAIEMLLEQ